MPPAGSKVTPAGPLKATAAPATALPDPLQESVRQFVSFLYDNREAAVVGNTITVTDISPGFYDLMAPYRMYVF